MLGFSFCNSCSHNNKRLLWQSGSKKCVDPSGGKGWNINEEFVLIHYIDVLITKLSDCTSKIL